MLEYLEANLIASLNEAKSVSIAVALIKDYGFNIIEGNVPKNCTRRYLVGINLPTSPNVLRRFLTLQSNFPIEIEAKIYKAKENYHPKVYLIEREDGELIAFVGSANATKGGFTHNIEMSFAITDQKDCVKLKAWFDALFNSARKYDDVYVDEYEISYKRNKALSSTQKSNISKILNDSSIPGINLIVSPDQYFSQSDFDAFSFPNQMLKTDAVVQLRAEVKERLIELAEKITPFFSDYGITDLNLAYRRNLYTSQHFHSGRSKGPKEAIWLQFGKSYSELMRYEGKFHQSITNHERIQIILRNTNREAYIGIWLYLCKHNSSYFDRKRLKDGLTDTDFVTRLYEYILALGASYWLMMGDDDEINVSDIKTSKDLVDFLLQDNYTQEIIIGRNYDPNDTDLSEENIEETVLIEFSKLYKIYALIKAPSPPIHPATP